MERNLRIFDMLIKILIFTIVNLVALAAYSQTDISLSERYQPETYTKYELKSEAEAVNISVFKINKDEPHLNPLFFDVYFQCEKTKAYYKLKRDFSSYDSEQTYCDNEKPVIEEIDGKKYLSLPMKLAEPGESCPDKVNRKEIFSIKQLREHCDKMVE